MEQHIKRCDRCIRFKAKTEVAPLESIEASYPMELVHIDYLTIESNKSERDVNILVVSDWLPNVMFSCWYWFKRKVYLGLVQTWCLESNKTIVMCVLFI